MKTILSFSFWLFIVLFLAYLAVELIPSDVIGGIDRVRIISDDIKLIANEIWHFARPFIQIVIILIIIQPLIKKLGLNIDFQSALLDWDIRSIIALIVIITFCFGALAGISESLAIKDVVLVVIGFYFGGLTRKTENNSKEPNN